MKNFTIIATIIVLLASCSEEQRAIDRFKKSLNDPSSFEFVEWTDEYVVVQPHYLEYYKARRDLFDKRFLDKELREYHKQNYDSSFVYSRLVRGVKVYKSDFGKIKHQMDDFYDFKKYNALDMLDFFRATIDTMALDTCYTYKTFNYRENNEFGAKVLKEGEVLIYR